MMGESVTHQGSKVQKQNLIVAEICRKAAEHAADDETHEWPNIHAHGSIPAYLLPNRHAHLHSLANSQLYGSNMRGWILRIFRIALQPQRPNGVLL